MRKSAKLMQCPSLTAVIAPKHNSDALMACASQQIGCVTAIKTAFRERMRKRAPVKGRSLSLV
jgi:hypothetical protein